MTTATDQMNSTLQIIFSFFLGLMVVALVGVGTNTFLPSPAERYDKQIQELYRQLDSYQVKSAADKDLSPVEQAEYDAIQDEIAQLSETSELETRDWARTSSIILVIFATLVMSISLIRAEQLRVLSNGLLLGGIFTMVYGAGWAVFSGSSPIRLVVVTFALIVTIGLGYLKFVRGRRRVGHESTEQLGTGKQVDVDSARDQAIDLKQQSVSGQAPSSMQDYELIKRIKAIEERLDAVAVAFGSKSEDD
ncbi:MAG: hypothetical protein GX562_01745 [Coriobacteriaceae bacterium]|nr:hypothetical protein [Coriobacteriaceae bacterium]